MKAYQWDAKDYSQHSSAQQSWARELIQKIGFQGNEMVLDIGCGDGKVTAEIAASVPEGEVLGIDTSMDMVRAARSSFGTPEFANLRFEVSNASELPFNNRFDVVFSNAALHWVRNHVPVLEGIYRSLRRGGRILLQMGGQGNAADIISVMNRMMATVKWGRYFHDFQFPYGFHDPQNYLVWLKAAGFQSADARLIPKDMCFSESAGLAGWVRTTWLPYTQRVPGQFRDEFINDLVDRYIRRDPTDSSEAISVKMVRLEVNALKPL